LRGRVEWATKLLAGVWLVRNAGVFFARFCAGLALFSDNCREIPITQVKPATDSCCLCSFEAAKSLTFWMLEMSD
jgi:hypothetical protein